ncbi:NTP pyrophosphohydrolase [Microbacterium arabinogalactanolyticum]|uniref:NTP pyrophosphohydrolase n=1 Tax=Microbacterium arabinogalactanolyticum TaxID=69365 RepID=UPI00404509DE
MSSTMSADGALRATHHAVTGLRGAVRVRERAIDKVVREASAGAIGVPRDEVAVDVSDWGRGVAVGITAKLPVPSLSDQDEIHSALPVLDRVRDLQSALAVELARLTGREITRVSFTVTGAVIAERRRVK